MNDKKTTSVIIDLKLHKLAKANGINISQCTEQGIKIQLGIVGGKEKLEENIEKQENKLKFMKDQLKNINEIEATNQETRVTEEQKHEKAIKECLSYHTEEYGLGKDKITHIAMKYDIEPEILIAEMEANPELKIEPFHMEIKQSQKSTFV